MVTNLFGTDGLRGSIGSSPFGLDHLPKLGIALAQWIQKTYGNNATILLAHDTRSSCSFVKAALSSGLLLHPLTMYDACTLPTPGVCKVIKEQDQFDCGIIISASHNPYQDTGIKIIDANTGKLSQKDEEAISTLFQKKHAHPIDYKQLGLMYQAPHISADYIKYLLQYFQPNLLNKITVVLDCAHGATYEIAPYVFKALGAHVIVMNNKPDGININSNCGTVWPQSLAHNVVKHKADVGFAFDGDGDRSIMVNKHGEIKNGDDILALLADHPTYKNQQGLIGTIMSNQGLTDFITAKNKQFIRTRVGDKYVAECLEKEDMLLGGEQSGHIIMRDYLATGDGIFTALRVLETMIITQNWDMKTFTRYPQVLINIPITHKHNLKQPEIAGIIEKYATQLDGGRVEVRYSGTENVLRIMVEDSNQERTERIGTALAKALQKKLTNPAGENYG